jgi:hypothetical protein
MAVIDLNLSTTKMDILPISATHLLPGLVGTYSQLTNSSPLNQLNSLLLGFLVRRQTGYSLARLIALSRLSFVETQQFS